MFSTLTKAFGTTSIDFAAGTDYGTGTVEMAVDKTLAKDEIKVATDAAGGTLKITLSSLDNAKYSASDINEAVKKEVDRLFELNKTTPGTITAGKEAISGIWKGYRRGMR